MSSHSPLLNAAETPTLASIAAAVARIEKALTGDEGMGHVGLVDRVASLEMRASAIEQQHTTEAAQKSGAIWVIGAAASVAGAICGFTFWLVNMLNAVPKP